MTQLSAYADFFQLLFYPFTLFFLATRGTILKWGWVGSMGFQLHQPLTTLIPFTSHLCTSIRSPLQPFSNHKPWSHIEIRQYYTRSVSARHGLLLISSRWYSHAHLILPSCISRVFAGSDWLNPKFSLKFANLYPNSYIIIWVFNIGLISLISEL